ncbi:MAG: hypothetical protein ABSG59_13870 [Verrucomicrobiota bacterium]|jgi:hypothetical protein
MTENALLWAQTITLFVTGLVVVWYTWETHKIRKDTARQNELISRQIDLMSQSLRFDITREESASEPIFKWRSGGGDFRRADVLCKFRNEGGAVTDLEVKTNDNVKASISPKDRLSEGEQGEVMFNNSPQASVPDVNYEIHYTTRQNRRGMTRFVLRANQGFPRTAPADYSDT